MIIKNTKRMDHKGVHLIEGGSAKVGLVKGREKGESHGDDEIIVDSFF